MVRKVPVFIEIEEEYRGPVRRIVMAEPFGKKGFYHIRFYPLPFPHLDKEPRALHARAELPDLDSGNAGELPQYIGFYGFFIDHPGLSLLLVPSV
jgi:hypothetical protein